MQPRSPWQKSGVALLVTTLPPSAERDGSEVDLRTRLGTAWMALRGWQVQEVWDSLHPALGPANALCRNESLLPILWGLFIHAVCRGRVAESLRWGETSGRFQPGAWWWELRPHRRHGTLEFRVPDAPAGADHMPDDSPSRIDGHQR